MAETTWQYTVQDYSPLLTYTASNGLSKYANLVSDWNNTCPYQVLPNGQYYNKAICDLGSTHTTNVAGAGVSLNFFGKGVTFYGSVSDGMGLEVSIDGTVSSSSRTTDGILASVSGLAQGNHTVTLTTKSITQNTESLFTFDHAIVTVGTGLTGANVRHVTFQDSDQMFTYTPIPNVTTIEMYDDWHIPHDAYNLTWRIADTVTFTFSGDAILLYGGSYSWFNTSTNQFTVGNESTGFISLNSAMPKLPPVTTGPNFLGNMYTSALLYAHTHLPSGNLLMFVDSNREATLQHLNLDYIEIVSVTGGSPLNVSSSTHHLSHSILAAIIVGPILGALLLLSLVFILFRKRRPEKARYPLDLSDDYRGSALNITTQQPMLSPLTQVEERTNANNQLPVQRPSELGSTTSSTGPYSQGASWTLSRDRFESAHSLPMTRRPIDQETEASPKTEGDETSAQELQELREERDHLRKLMSRSPPPEYTPGTSRANPRAGKH